MAGNLFSELQREKERQQATLKQADAEQIQAKDTQKATQMSKSLSKPPSRSLSKLLTTDDVENLAFLLRRVTKARVNADIPHEWKERLDERAYRLKVGKYDLMLYIIAVFLGEVED